MPDNHASSPSRMLAPAALLVAVVAVGLIVLGSGGSGGSDGDSKSETTTTGQRTATSGERGRPRERTTYTVRPGDNLGVIAEKTGMDVERLQELNPSLDPQALVAGQKIKLRE